MDYPDSLPAVHDVRDCLAHASLQQHFVSRFRAAIRKRLLHAGTAKTSGLSSLEARYLWHAMHA